MSYEELSKEQLLKELASRDKEIETIKKLSLRGRVLRNIHGLVKELEELDENGQNEMLETSKILLNVMDPNKAGINELNFLHTILEVQLKEQHIFNAGYNSALSGNPLKRIFKRKR